MRTCSAWSLQIAPTPTVPTIRSFPPAHPYSYTDKNLKPPIFVLLPCNLLLCCDTLEIFLFSLSSSNPQFPQTGFKQNSIFRSHCLSLNPTPPPPPLQKILLLGTYTWPPKLLWIGTFSCRFSWNKWNQRTSYNIGVSVQKEHAISLYIYIYIYISW